MITMHCVIASQKRKTISLDNIVFEGPDGSSITATWEKSEWDKGTLQNINNLPHTCIYGKCMNVRIENELHQEYEDLNKFIKDIVSIKSATVATPTSCADMVHGEDFVIEYIKFEQELEE